jgi:colanic acid/amylovoran biosynthesis glycosyltransferase
MKVAYLVNHYPAPSHSFIRREILALEASGLEVLRISIRPPKPSDDAADKSEAAKTLVLLNRAGIIPLATALAGTALQPARTFRAKMAAFRLFRRGGGLVRHMAYLAEAARVVRLCKRHKVTHLHAHFGTNPAAVAMLARILGGPTYTFTVHGPEEFDAPHALALDLKASQSAGTIAISSFGRSQLFRLLPDRQWPTVHIVRCGVDAQFLSAGSPVTDTAHFVSIGRLCEQKGQAILLRAFAGLLKSHPQARLTLIGDGPLGPRLRDLAQELNMGSAITFAGRQTGDQIRATLLQSRAMVLPSFAEGLPVVLMEAMALGRPVITTFVAGIPELVLPGVNGWLVPAGSEDDLTTAMRNCLETSVSQLADMGKQGRAAVESLHNVTHSAASLVHIWSNIAAGPVAPAQSSATTGR